MRTVHRLSRLFCALIAPLWFVQTATLAADDRPARPIVFTLYTVHDGVLKLTAQIRPEDSEADLPKVFLDVKRGDGWDEIAETAITNPGWSAMFRVERWNHAEDAEFRVRYRKDTYAGLIRRDPAAKRVIVAAAFTGNSPAPGGGKISKQDVVENVNKVDPDVLLFTGDQVYNHNDHLGWWVRFGEIFGELTRRRPTVCIPDDHDVGHPNLWGAGGRKARRDWDGGYLKSPAYVNMVQRQQTSHLPDPHDPTPVEQGITVYYTNLVVGGIDFAIVEDRKWKSGCSDFAVPQKGLGPRPDHIVKPDYDPEVFDVADKKLLGNRQLKFLRDWSGDWGGVTIKCVVSQTVWSMVSNYHSAGKRFYYADFDANGWPQTGRNKALSELQRCCAFHINGDQHLSTILQYGIDDWRDAGWSFCVPSIANLYPRWWRPKQPGNNREPDAPAFTGDHLDGFGNKITVYAATNPRKTGRQPAALHDRMPGFGIVLFDKKSRQITMQCWPRMVDPTDPNNADKQYEGWPRTISQFDNDGRPAVAYLPTLKIRGMTDPVVKVINDKTGEMISAVRILGDTFRPKVFAEGAYTLVVGEPGSERLKTLKGIEARPEGKAKTLEIDF